MTPGALIRTADGQCGRIRSASDGLARVEWVHWRRGRDVVMASTTIRLRDVVEVVDPLEACSRQQVGK